MAMEISYISAEMSEDLEAALDAGAAAGCRCVSLRSPVWGAAMEDLDEARIERARQALARHGLRPGMLLSPVGKCGLSDAERIADHDGVLERTFDLARALNTDRVRVFPFRAPSDEPDASLDACLDRVAARWAPWVERAAVAQITLCFEWVPSTLVRTGAQMRRVIDAVGAPEHVGVIWEIDTSTQAGAAPEVDYGPLRGRIRDVHVKPFGAGASRAQYLRALRLLQADGYSGPVTVEHWGGEAETQAGIAAVRGLIHETEGDAVCRGDGAGGDPR
jgi:sugar phosphate isomerase/epimerase